MSLGVSRPKCRPRWSSQLSAPLLALSAPSSPPVLPLHCLLFRASLRSSPFVVVLPSLLGCFRLWRPDVFLSFEFCGAGDDVPRTLKRASAHPPNRRLRAGLVGLTLPTRPGHVPLNSSARLCVAFGAHSSLSRKQLGRNRSKRRYRVEIGPLGTTSNTFHLHSCAVSQDMNRKHVWLSAGTREQSEK